ncbi:MAG: hypothetical protein Q7T40_07505 [Methylobacter sp.]|nr:hypothetical protein [Methylobacter sp.]
MRNVALHCLHRAKDLIAQDDEISAKYACLELRFCIEYITYSQLQIYLKEVPNDTVKKWTPKQIINAVRRMICRVDSPLGNPPQLRKTVIGVVSLPQRLIESGSRTRRRDTFFCVAKRKYPKKKRPGCRLVPAFIGTAYGIKLVPPANFLRSHATILVPTRCVGMQYGTRYVLYLYGLSVFGGMDRDSRRNAP